jgi:hypothetical protein
MSRSTWLECSIFFAEAVSPMKNDRLTNLFITRPMPKNLVRKEFSSRAICDAMASMAGIIWYMCPV